MVFVPCRENSKEEKVIATLGEAGISDKLSFMENTFANVPADTIRNWKLLGFGDEQIATLFKRQVWQYSKIFKMHL